MITRVNFKFRLKMVKLAAVNQNSKIFGFVFHLNKNQEHDVIIIIYNLIIIY